MQRRQLLEGIASVGIATGLLGKSTAESSDRGVRRRVFQLLKREYGEQEAEIIAEGVADGKEVEEILYHPELTNARKDYLEYEYSKPSTAQEVDERLLDVAASEEIPDNESTQTLDSNWDFDDPCWDRYEGGPSTSAYWTFNGFQWQHAHKSTYGVSDASYSSDCSWGDVKGMNAKASAKVYGSAQVTLRHVAPAAGGDWEYEGSFTVVGKFDAEGVAPDGSATLSLLKYDSSTGAIQKDQVKEVTTSIDREVSGQTTFEFSQGDHVGVELAVSASTGGGAALADFKTNSRGVDPTVELHH